MNYLGKSLMNLCRSFSKQKKNLIRELDKKITSELKNYKPSEDVQYFLRIFNLELEDFPETTKTILRKKINHYDVEINFKANSQISDTTVESLENASNAKVSKKYEEFNIFITDTRKGSGVYLDCTTYNSRLFISHIVFANDMKIFYDTKASSYLYHGPSLEEYNFRITELIYEYIKEFGIEPEYGNFIESYSPDKEYRLYIKWLDDVKRFLES